MLSRKENEIVKSERVGRVVKILTALQSGKKCGVKELADMFGTSQRTIFRDLKQLQAVGVPYHYDTETGGYTIEPEFFLPPIDLNLQEALSLLLLAHKVSSQIQLPYRRSAILGALKIENNLPLKMRKYCNITLENISTRSGPQTPMRGLDETFAALQKAINRKQMVYIRYKSLFEQKTIELNLSPYHLLYNRRAWYVLGHSDMHKSIRTFKLNRMLQIKTLSQRFTIEEGFEPAEHFGRAWSMIPGGRIYNVKLRFLPKVAENVTEVRWHDTQKVQRQRDGSAIVEFRVDGLNEMSWWILGYGDQVQVLAPKALRRIILGRAKNLIKLNSAKD